MEAIYIKSLLSLAVVLGLMYLCLKLIQKFTKLGTNNLSNIAKENAITINSVAYIDPTAKIVNLSCSNKKYLILIGKNTNLLIDSYENKPS